MLNTSLTIFNIEFLRSINYFNWALSNDQVNFYTLNRIEVIFHVNKLYIIVFPRVFQEILGFLDKMALKDQR